MTDKNQDLIPIEIIQNRIFIIRGHKVMIDTHLAELYDVETKTLNQSVSRNIDRFPKDFMFVITKEEWELLNRSQIVTGSQKHRDMRFLPRVFTQEGIAMLAGILRSKRAIAVNIAIMRTFVQLREIFATHKDLAEKINEHDQQIAYLFEQIRQILEPQPAPKHPIGFQAPDKKDK